MNYRRILNKIVCKNRKNIVLIGMPGCGKTTIGRLLANELKLNFCDMDKYIEETSGETIAEIFQRGEEEFRTLEKKAAIDLSYKCRTVVSTGGGVVKYKENIDNLSKSGIIIFIDRPVEEIISDIDTEARPLLNEGKERLYNLHEERYKLYNEYCDIRVENVGYIKDVVIKIVELIKLEV